MNDGRPAAAVPDNDIYANPPDIDALELEPGHPGLGDDAYIARREALFALCRRHRLGKLGPPLIDYTDEEERICGIVSLGDLAREADEECAEEALEGVSQPGGIHRQ